MENKFEWQGKRRDQVEFSYKIIGWSFTLLCGMMTVWMIIEQFR